MKNNALDKAIAKPVAKAYKKVTPRIVRTGVSNFISNLGSVTTVVNDVLQGKMFLQRKTFYATQLSNFDAQIASARANLKTSQDEEALPKP